MISRGFEGRIPAFRLTRFMPADAGFIGLAAVLIIGVRAAFR